MDPLGRWTSKSCRDLDRGHRYREDLRLDCHRPFTHPRTWECGLGENLRKYFCIFWGGNFSLFTHPWTSECRLAENPGKYFHNLLRSLFLPLTPTPADENAIWTKNRKSFLGGMSIGSIYHRTSICRLAPWNFIRGGGQWRSFLKLFYRTIFSRKLP